MAEGRFRWQVLSEDFVTEIRAGQWPIGELLPSVRVSMRDREVSDNTVTRAYADLAERGFVRPEQGIGVRVVSTEGRVHLSTDDRVEDHEARIKALEEQVQRLLRDREA